MRPRCRAHMAPAPATPTNPAATVPFCAPGGSAEPPGQGWRETAFISSRFCSPFASPSAHLAGLTAAATSDTLTVLPGERSAPQTPMRRWFSKGNKGQLARQPSWCGTTLFTQETEFFLLKTNIYIYLFFHVKLRQNKSVWPQSVDSPNLKLRTEACHVWARAQRDKARGGRQASQRAFLGGTRCGEGTPGSEQQAPGW